MNKQDLSSYGFAELKVSLEEVDHQNPTRNTMSRRAFQEESTIHHLPWEIIAHIFILGCQLSRQDIDDYREYHVPSSGIPMLKPFADVVSQVCVQWRDVVAGGKHFKIAYVSLQYPDPVDFSFQHQSYNSALEQTEGVDIDILWRFSNKHHRTGRRSEFDFAVKLFMDAMATSLVYCEQWRRVLVDISPPSLFCFVISALRSSRCAPDVIPSISLRGHLTRFEIIHYSGESGKLLKGLKALGLDSFDKLDQEIVLPRMFSFNIHGPNLLKRLSFSGSIEVLTIHISSKGEDSFEWLDIERIVDSASTLRHLSLTLPGSNHYHQISQRTGSPRVTHIRHLVLDLPYSMSMHFLAMYEYQSLQLMELDII